MKHKTTLIRLPTTYDTYIFDLYGTLVDIHTEEKEASYLDLKLDRI